jgi:hypothetical protein
MAMDVMRRGTPVRLVLASVPVQALMMAGVAALISGVIAPPAAPAPPAAARVRVAPAGIWSASAVCELALLPKGTTTCTLVMVPREPARCGLAMLPGGKSMVVVWEVAPADVVPSPVPGPSPALGTAAVLELCPGPR